MMERHAVDTLGVVLIMRSRVEGKDFGELLCFRRRNLGKNLGVEFNFKVVPSAVVGEAATGIRVSVSVGDVWFDVVDWRTVHQIGSAYDNLVVLYCDDSDRRQTKIIWAEGRAGCKDSDALVASETWWTHGRVECFFL